MRHSSLLRTGHAQPIMVEHADHERSRRLLKRDIHPLVAASAHTRADASN
jgi:hypothetical protein